MSVVKEIEFNKLINFSHNGSFLSYVNRKKPSNANAFFKKLLRDPFNINHEVFKKSSREDIKDILDATISSKLRDDIFYNKWVIDMAKICNLFCEITDDISLSFSLETSRGCKRFHIDNVPMRLLVTYYGKGTEWFPSHACDYNAYYRGEPNEKIIKKVEEKRNINSWDIAIFKGNKYENGEKAILHRTPDEALNKLSLLMRLDHSQYVSDIRV